MNDPNIKFHKDKDEEGNVFISGPTGRRLRVPDTDCCAPRDLNFFPLDEPQTPVKTDLEKLLEMATNVAVNNAYAARDREALERLAKVFAETIAPVANRRGRKVS